MQSIFLGIVRKNMITKNGYEKLKKKLSEEWNSATYYYMKSILILDFGGLLSNYIFPGTLHFSANDLPFEQHE